MSEDQEQQGSIPECRGTEYEPQDGKEHLRRAAESVRAAVEVTAGELRQAAETKAGEIRAKARTLTDDTEAYVRENPLRAVLTALGIGFVLGLIFRR